MQSFELELDNWDGFSQLDIDSEDYNVFTVNVEYRFSEVVKGKWCLSNGDPGYPDEGGEIEEWFVYDELGNDISSSLTQRQASLVEKEIYNHFENR